MSCPKFIDSVRRCEKEFGEVTDATFKFCINGNHQDCPILKTIEQKNPICEYFKNCPIYKNFKVSDFDKFVDLTSRFCLSENNKNCVRYQLNIAQEPIPADLLPDGSVWE